jgi:hypothetical protein
MRLTVNVQAHEGHPWQLHSAPSGDERAWWLRMGDPIGGDLVIYVDGPDGAIELGRRIIDAANDYLARELNAMDVMNEIRYLTDDEAEVRHLERD